MWGFRRYLCLLLLMFAQACNAVGESPAETVSGTPEASPLLPTPIPSLTSTVQPSPFPFTPTAQPPTITPTSTPTEAPRIYAPEGNLIQPSNDPDEWLLYDSPQSVTTLLFDRESMWAGSRNGGLVQWDPQSLTSLRHTRASGFPLRTVTDLAFDAASGYLYAVGDEGLAVWDGTHWEDFTSAELGFLPDDPLTAVAVESGTTIWVGAREWVSFDDWYLDKPALYGGGLARGDWQAGFWEQFRAPDPLLSNQINDLAVGPDGSLWVASGGDCCYPPAGGVSYRSSDGEWEHWGFAQGASVGSMDGLAGYDYHFLAISPDGRVYAANRHRVSWLNPGTDSWQYVAIGGTRQIALDANDRLWITADQGLYQLTANFERQHIFKPEGADYWWEVGVDGDGNVWLGGELGLFRVRSEGVQQLFVLDALPGLWVSDVAVNGDDTIWLRSGGMVSHLVGDLIITYASENQAIEAAYPWTGRDSLWPIAPDGTLWLLKQDTFWGYNTNGWQSVAVDISPDENIYSFTAGSNGVLIVAAKAGLLIYTPGEGWITVPQSQRLFYRNIVYNEPTNTLWGSTGNSYVFPGQVASYSLSTNVLTVYHQEEEGVFYQDIPPGGVGISPDGAVWAVSTRGEVAIFAADSSWQPQQINTQGAMGFGEIYFGNSTDLWLITIDVCGFEYVCHSGLVYFDGMNSYRFTEGSSFRPGTYWINDLSVDSQGNAWLATSIGLQSVPAP